MEVAKRGMHQQLAQPGSARRSERRGRRFESYIADLAVGRVDKPFACKAKACGFDSHTAIMVTDADTAEALVCEARVTGSSPVSHPYHHMPLSSTG